MDKLLLHPVVPSMQGNAVVMDDRPNSVDNPFEMPVSFVMVELKLEGLHGDFCIRCRKTG
jgi:hypothetical protein